MVDKLFLFSYPLVVKVFIAQNQTSAASVEAPENVGVARGYLTVTGRYLMAFSGRDLGMVWLNEPWSRPK